MKRTQCVGCMLDGPVVIVNAKARSETVRKRDIQRRLLYSP